MVLESLCTLFSVDDFTYSPICSRLSQNLFKLLNLVHLCLRLTYVFFFFRDVNFYSYSRKSKIPKQHNHFLKHKLAQTKHK